MTIQFQITVLFWSREYLQALCNYTLIKIDLDLIRDVLSLSLSLHVTYFHYKIMSNTEVPKYEYSPAVLDEECL